MPGSTETFSRMRKLARALLFIGIISSGFVHAQGRLANEPMILKPGEVTVLPATESKLIEKVVFWTSFPMERETQEGRIHLRPGKDSPLGVHFLRALAGDTVSPWQTVLLDELPVTVRSDRKNDSPTNAFTLNAASALTGTIQPGKSEYFHVKLAQGQSITVEVLANRLLSSLDPFLRLLDSQGRQLAFSDDEPGLGKDSRIRYTAKSAQSVVIEVRDSFYQGGDKHVYVLRWGDFPEINTAVATDNTIAWFGRDVTKITGTGLPSGLANWFTARWKGTGVAAMMTSPLNLVEATVEKEPNDQRNAATTLAVPGSIYGRFEKNGDTDWYVWDGRKGEKYLVRAQTRSLAFPTDVRLSSHGPDGKTISSSKLVTEDEGSLEVTPSEDGKVYLRVNHIAGLAGPEQGYRLNIRTVKSGFDAKTESDKVVVTPGGTADLKLTLDRTGYDGAIEYELVPKIEGLSLTKGTVEAKKKEATLQLKAAGDLPTGRLYQVRLQAINPPGGHVQNFTTLTNQYGPSSTMAAVLDGWITVGIKAAAEKESKPKSP